MRKTSTCLVLGNLQPMEGIVAAFELSETVAVLSRTPGTLRAWLTGLSPRWLDANEGPETFSPFDVVGHLIHGERTDWIPRARVILAGDPEAVFEPFDRFAMLEQNRNRSLAQLLDTFEELRLQNLETLLALEISAEDLQRMARHPVVGVVSLEQLLNTWVAHDLEHLAQIARVMAKTLREGVGSWRSHLPLLDR